ncbi:PREDICTED: protein yellow-like [Nicrophorus vespilloides]|uniref:Protein yellow-like n=1 Tax=Nicrophorus vespilloides TaxID=110193 RepID=A0ABM1MW18_NICVS|nr:PREDICTED: protein yellow-like [Nicrophorus vespilloides]
MMWLKIGILLCVGLSNAVDLEILNEWNLLDFNFPDYEFIKNFKPENTVFTGLEITDDRLILAMPRLRAGIPATLASIPRNTPKGSSPKLDAYPDWSFHAAGVDNTSCTGLVSVYRIRQDSCNRLWVLDSGVQTSIDNFQRVCDPKLVIFDLRTDTVVRTVVFPKEVLRPASLMTNLVIDESVNGKCDSALVYMSDTAAPGVVVYDSSKDNIWRFMHPSMFPDPNFSDYTIDNERFTLMDGIVGLGFSPNRGLLYYQPLATDRIFSVSTSVLRKGPLAEGVDLPVALVGKKSSQGLGLAVDSFSDTLYFSPLEQTSIASWNPKSNQERLLAFDPQKLQFLAEIRWAEKDGGNVWALSTRFQKFFRRTVNGNEINLRIVRVPKATEPQFPLSNSLLYF